MAKRETSNIDLTFRALADSTRRGVLQRLIHEPGLSVSDLADTFALKLPGMTKHLDVLSDAGLVTRKKNGRTVAVFLSAEPMLEAIEWLRLYERFWTVSLNRLVALVEAETAK
jgi:DNA-binding transcriptional ArsR family regulator